MPSRLGRYAVRRRVGAGGFATVWLAYDEQLDAPVAIKVLADNWTEDHQVRRRFLEEGRYLRRVESPHVVQVFDAGELEDGRPYLVMTYADQGTLADRLEVDGLEAAQALEVVRQVGAGLAALHRRDILHRDVKPANVLFRTVDGSVRAMVADLGLGKALDVSSRLTMVAGTPSFVAPEQARGEPLDARADQYSLGALTYLLLAGRAPYSHASLTAAASPAPPPRLSTDERPYGDAVDDVVRRALAADPAERWPDVASYVDALAASLAAELGPAGASGAPTPWLPVDPELTQPGARPSPPTDVSPTPAAPGVPPRGRRRLRAPARALVGLVAGLVASVGGAVGGYAWQQSRPDPDVRVSDASGYLSVVVPPGWHRAVADDGWRAPQDGEDYPALSLGTTRDWVDPAVRAEGVFVGLMPGDALPAVLPGHPECSEAGGPVTDDDSTTVVHRGCSDGVTVERVVRVAANRVLWVQVRSADTATANRVLDSVETHGL